MSAEYDGLEVAGTFLVVNVSRDYNIVSRHIVEDQCPRNIITNGKGRLVAKE